MGLIEETILLALVLMNIMKIRVKFVHLVSSLAKLVQIYLLVQEPVLVKLLLEQLLPVLVFLGTMKILPMYVLFVLIPSQNVQPLIPQQNAK